MIGGKSCRYFSEKDPAGVWISYCSVQVCSQKGRSRNTRSNVAYVELKNHLEQLERNQGLIFTTSTNGPISPRNFIRHFKQALKSARLPGIRVHNLRHSHASSLLASGVNPKLVQDRLGHASIMLALDTYSHVIPSLQEEVARRMEDLMS